MALGIAGQQADLAGEVLDVVHDEGHAAIELVEARRVLQGILPGLFGQIARHLLSGDAQQVEIFPVEPTRDMRPGKDHDAHETLAVQQWHTGPGRRLIAQPFRHRSGRVPKAVCGSHRIEIENHRTALHPAEQRERQGGGRHFDGRPAPSRGQREFFVLAGGE